MLVSINQPAYLPWMGYFHRIAVSDVHVVLDHVQFEKNSFTNRNRIRTPEGSCWLTVPVKTKGRFGDLAIADLEIDDARQWRKKHWRALAANYGKAPWFADHAAYFEAVYARPWRRLAELVRDMLGYQLEAFGIDTPLVFSSEMDLAGRKAGLVLEICQAVGADAYLSGPLGRDYLDESVFLGAGVSVGYDDFVTPRYRQVCDGFEPDLAAVDLLFNEGPRSREILLGGQELMRG
jgi:hypothetical protein